MMTLEQVVPGTVVLVEKVGGTRAFRRRIMELGVIPGTRVRVLRVAPLGDPLELSARGCNLSIRAAEARQVEVAWAPSERPVPSVDLLAGLAKSAP